MCLQHSLFAVGEQARVPWIAPLCPSSPFTCMSQLHPYLPGICLQRVSPYACSLAVFQAGSHGGDSLFISTFASADKCWMCWGQGVGLVHPPPHTGQRWGSAMWLQGLLMCSLSKETKCLKTAYRNSSSVQWSSGSMAVYTDASILCLHEVWTTPVYVDPKVIFGFQWLWMNLLANWGKNHLLKVVFSYI